MICNFYKKFPSGKTLKGKPTNFEGKVLSGIKIHTMREDVNMRWREGMTISLTHGARSKSYYCFKAAIVKKIQNVRFDYSESASMPLVYIDGRRAGIIDILLLAANDGFDTLAGFIEYFCENKTYRLLHWTDFSYDGDMAKTQQRHDVVQALYMANHITDGKGYKEFKGSIGSDLILNNPQVVDESLNAALDGFNAYPQTIGWTKTNDGAPVAISASEVNKMHNTDLDKQVFSLDDEIKQHPFFNERCSPHVFKGDVARVFTMPVDDFYKDAQDKGILTVRKDLKK